MMDDSIAVSTDLLDLPRPLLSSVLRHLCYTPHDIISFGFTCRAAQSVADDEALWQLLCCSVTQQSPASINPTAWQAQNFKHLYLGLVYPYRDLFQQKLWHSSLWPCGRLLLIAAAPPRLVARSVFYKTLNGGPYCHEVFRLGFSKHLEQCSKALVEVCKLQTLFGGSHLFRGLGKLLPASPSTSAAQSNGSSGSTSGQQQQQQPYSTDGFCVAAAPLDMSNAAVAVDEYTCRHCRHLHCTYAETQQQQQQQQQHSSQATAGASASRLPLPEMHLSIEDDMLMSFVRQTLSHQSMAVASSAKLPVYKPFYTTHWLQLQHSGSDTATADVIDTAQCTLAYALPGLWKGTYAGHGIELLLLQLAVAPVGVELGVGLATDNKAGRAGSGAAGTAAAGPGGSGGDGSTASVAADQGSSSSSMQPGVLLSGLAGVGEAVAQQQHHQTDAAIDEASTASDAAELEPLLAHSTTAQHHQQQGNDTTPAHTEQHLQDQAAAAAAARGGEAQQQQQRRVLLVASKVLGDINVPAGCVTFAVDVSNSSSEGWGQALQLPQGVSSRVNIGQTGAKQLMVKERYCGRAQIAAMGFKDPATVAAELVVFDCDCFGVIWKAPLNSFSLFSRVTDPELLP